MLKTRRCRSNGAWIGRIVKTYDYINRVVLMLSLTVYEGTWTYTLPSRCYAITMNLRVRRIFLKLLRSPTTRTSLHIIFSRNLNRNTLHG